MKSYLQFRENRAAAAAECAIVVLDASPSMDGTDWPPSRLGAAVEASEALIRVKVERYPNDLVGVVTFAARARVEHPPVPAASGASSLVGALRGIKTRGSTNLTAGLEKAVELLNGQGSSSSWTGQRLRGWLAKLVFEDTQLAQVPQPLPRGANRIIALTDGHHNVGHQDDVLALAGQLKQHGVCIDVIGIGGDHAAVDEPLLKRVASTNADGSPRYYFIGDKMELIREFKKLAHHIKRA